MTLYTISVFILIVLMFIYWTAAFIILYHLIRFGISGQPKKIAAFFLAGSLVFTVVGLLLFSQINFSEFKEVKSDAGIINYPNIIPGLNTK